MELFEIIEEKYIERGFESHPLRHSFQIVILYFLSSIVQIQISGLFKWSQGPWDGSSFIIPNGMINRPAQLLVMPWRNKC